jgi:DNA-directed RNA polymerase beta subunit
MDAFFEKNEEYNVFSENHIESFEHFIENDLEIIITQRKPITYTHKTETRRIKGVIEFDSVHCQTPRIIDEDGKEQSVYPNYCRTINSTYSLSVRAGYKFKILISDNNGKNEKMVFNYESNDDDPILIGNIPCMVGSKFCSLRGQGREQLLSINEDVNEIGGYFIIRGTEFIITPQENKIQN